MSGRSSATDGAATRAWLGLEGAEGLPQAPARRRIELADIDYAKAHRRKGWGWQALAKQLQVNETDLRRACGDLDAVPPAPLPAAVAAVRPKLRVGSKIAELLIACLGGETNYNELARLSGMTRFGVATSLSRLRELQLLRGHGATPTGAGVAEAKLHLRIQEAARG